MIQNEALQLAIETAQAAGEIETVEVDGRTYYRDNLKEFIEPKSDAFTVHTLDAVAKYCNADPDSLSGNIMVRVVDPTKATVCGYLRDDRQREYFLNCNAYGAGNFERNLNHYHGHIDMMIFLQTHFVKTETLTRLLGQLGNIDDEESINIADDGMTQEITVKKGAAIRETDNVQNPVLLIPRRSFPEIELDPVPFIVRLEARPAGGMPSIGIFESDGGNWKVDAVNKAGAYLADKLPDGMTLLF